jgi:hypothetical protein
MFGPTVVSGDAGCGLAGFALRTVLGASGCGWNNCGVSPAGSGRARFDDGPVTRAGRVAGWCRSQRLIIAWLGGLGLIAVSGMFSATLGFVVILCACVLMGSVLGTYGGDSTGLRNHRQ